MPLLLQMLLNAGLPLIASAVKAKGTEIIEDKLGVKLTPDMTPEQLADLATKETANKQWLEEMAFKTFEAELADRKDARAMQTAALAGSDEFSKRFIYNLATACLLFSAVYIFWITFGTIPATNLRFADTILGFLLGTMISTIIYFFFGSSKQNKDKDATITNLLTK